MAHPLFSFLRSFFSSDFTDESEAFLLIGLLTDFRGYLASGQWLAPEIFPYCFCHADFADDADFFVGYFPFSEGICNDRIGRLRVNP